MKRNNYRIFCPLAFLSMLAAAGCSDTPKAPPRFQIDSQSAAQEAIRLYDKNRDGKLDANELKASPPLRELLQNLKARSPGHGDSLTAEDISGRMEEWMESPAILFSITAIVFLDGKSLEGETVTYEPEPYLGSSYHSHQGITNRAGNANLDSELKDYPGLYAGLYRIRISKKLDGKETLPVRYNSETELGRELARDAGQKVMFELKSK